MLSSTDPLGNLTAFVYDPYGNLTSVTDAKTNATLFAPDIMDRRQSRTDALQHSESFAYDEIGNLKQFIDRNGKVTTFAYDGLNRPTLAGFGTQPGPIYDSAITTAYTDDGARHRIITTTDSISGTITRLYDGLYRLTSETTPQGAVSYIYDKASRRTSMTVAGQPQVIYTYDVANRLTMITQGTSVTLFGYDNANRRTSLTLPNLVKVTYVYDNASQLTSLTYKKGNTMLGNLTYGYDKTRRRTSVGGSFARTGLPQAVAAATYNANTQLTQWGGATLTYDLNGNMKNDGTNTYTWDSRNQLASMNALNFQYDAFGRRIQNSTGNKMLYDGVDSVQELSGTIPVANRVTGGLDAFFNRTDTTGSSFPLMDALGSAIALTDSTGALKTQYTYEPFGNSTVTGQVSSN